LYFGLLACNECLHLFRGFIVQLVQFWGEATLLAESVDFLVGAEELLLLSALDWDAFDVVCIVDVKDTHVLHSSVADPWEHTSLIAANESF